MISKFYDKLLKLTLSIKTDIILELGTKENMKQLVSTIPQGDLNSLGLPSKVDSIIGTLFVDDAITYYIFKKDEKVFGFIGVQVSGDHIEVIYLYIDKEFRGKGISKKVINALKESFKKVDFYVYKINTKMTKILLDSNGKIIKDSDDDGEMTIRVQK